MSATELHYGCVTSATGLSAAACIYRREDIPGAVANSRRRVLFTESALQSDRAMKLYCFGCQSSKHETLNQCWVDGGPPSLTVDQHLHKIGSTPRV